MKMEAAFNRRMRKTARTVVWEGAGAQSPAPDPIGRRDTAPAGAGTAPDTADPVFQQALEILRREVPPPGQVQSLESKVQSPTGEVQGPKSKVQSPEPAGAATLRTQTLPTLDFRPETLDCAVPPSALPTQILPARMLNEFVYCPRLFYYEFVESVFVQSADTLRGKALHRRVDSGKGDLPAAPGKEEGRRGQKSEDRGQKTALRWARPPQPSTLNPQPRKSSIRAPCRWVRTAWGSRPRWI
jgi:CRISPR-associated protein Cas1